MKFLSIFYFIVSIFTPSYVHAEDVKIAFVNTERIFREAKEATKITKRLEQEFSIRRDQLKKLADRRAKLTKDLEKLSNPEEIKRLQREFSSTDRDYQVQYAGVREDYAQRRDEEFSMLRDKANQAIIKVAKEGGFDLILQDVVFAHPRLDITDKILKVMDD